MELHPIRTGNLRVSEAGQFIIRYFSDVESSGIDLQKDIDFYTVHTILKMQSNAYDEAMKQIKAMAETKELETLDLHRDQMVSTLRRAISLFEYTDDKNEQDAYHAARIIMKNYAGLEKENYEAETFDIQKLLQEWKKPEHTNIVSILWLSIHLDNLKKSAEQFDALFNNRSNITVQKVAYDTLALKRQMMDSYYKLVNYIAGTAAVKTTDKEYYLKIMDAINNGRKYFGDLLARRKGSAGKDVTDTTENEK